MTRGDSQDASSGLASGPNPAGALGQTLRGQLVIVQFHYSAPASWEICDCTIVVDKLL